MSARSKLQKGDMVTISKDTHAWYSGYGANAVRIIRAGEPLTIQSTDVPSPLHERVSYDVARTSDGWQISTIETEFSSIE